jgi:hypothetical protein
MSQILLQGSWTGTNWINDGEKKIVFKKNYRLDEPWMRSWIKNYWELLQKIWKNWRFKSVASKFETLKEKLSEKYSSKVDPVEFLANLYYWEWLSAESIMERLQQLWIEYNNVNSVLSLLNTTLWWNLRDSWEFTSITKRKRVENQRRQWQILTRYTLQESERIREKCISIIDDFSKPSTEEVTLEKKRIYQWKPLTRALYILKTCKWIGIDEISSIYSNGIGLDVISQILQDILNAIIEEQKLNISIKIHKNSLIWQLEKKWVYRENWNLKRIK